MTMTPALFSVSYAGGWGQHTLSVVDFIHKAAALGYPAVEIGGKRPHLSPLDYPDEASLAPIREAAAATGVRIATVAAYTDFAAGRQAPEVPFVEMQWAYVRDLARMASALGAGIVRVFSGYSQDPAHLAADWNRTVAALREGARICADQGVILGLQNHHDLGLATPAFEELLGEVDHPNLKAMFDPWSIALIGEDLQAAAQRLAPRMVQTTLADYVRLDRYAYRTELVNYQKLDPPLMRAVPLGQGMLDLPAFFRGLRAGGFQGLVAYEMCSPLRGGGSEANLDQAARLSLQAIRRLIHQD